MEVSGVLGQDPLVIEQEKILTASIATKIEEVAYLVLKSPLVWMFIGMGCASIVLPYPFAIGCVVVVIGGMVLFPHHIPSALLYEVSLVDTLVRDQLTQWKVINAPYYNEILPGMYLGALPLRSHHHHVVLIKDLKVGAILALVEDFELDREVFFAVPVRKQDWADLLVKVCHISIPDMTMMSLDDLHQAADFIKEHEGSIYIHCKAGRGRSVTAVMAYLIKYKSMTYVEAYSFMGTKRPIMTLVDSQKKGLQAFEQALNEVDAGCREIEL